MSAVCASGSTGLEGSISRKAFSRSHCLVACDADNNARVRHAWMCVGVCTGLPVEGWQCPV